MYIILYIESIQYSKPWTSTFWTLVTSHSDIMHQNSNVLSENLSPKDLDNFSHIH